jgi:hypothetical protein
LQAIAGNWLEKHEFEMSSSGLSRRFRRGIGLRPAEWNPPRIKGGLNEKGDFINAIDH